MTDHRTPPPGGDEMRELLASAKRHVLTQLSSEAAAKRRRRIRAAGTFSVGVIALGGATAAASTGVFGSSFGFPSGPDAPPKPGEPVTIGPWAKDRPAPDLVPIDLPDGRHGFLRTYDMAHGSQNPEFSRKTGKHSDETVLPVYEKDGQTVIGEFVAGTSRSE